MHYTSVPKRALLGAAILVLLLQPILPFGAEIAKVFAGKISLQYYTLLPDGDNAAGWPSLTDGNSDGETCDATHHWYCINESGSPVTTDYINTGTSGTTGETEDYTMQNPSYAGTFLHASTVSV